ncbi:trichome birefringence-like [Thalictrum thalictroides]|uniref:Trichome birefringence-like n=1 Tax=Thalictrum thalictroides TaxID=46969 RepID=A0A7J6WEU9_THATH|nr:trichome birefringence-like [Thalictrum thalictroides]
MGKINSWKWVPENCSISPHIDPYKFLELMRNKNIGFVGDSLNENFIVSFLCILRVADNGAKKWKKKGAWRGGYFPKFNVTVAYHRAVLLAKYQWQPGIAKSSSDRELNGVYRVDVDTPAEDWVEVTKFYNVLVFNTGHWWGIDKFPKEKPLVFYLKGQQIFPPLGIFEGLKVVLDNIISHIQREVPRETLKFWRMQSPRHFYGGEWNENGSCLFNKPLEGGQLDRWFDPSNQGVNKEARQVNQLIEEAVQDTDIQLLDITHLSEFRADGHPAIWLGKKDAVAIWGQDCLHWCLPGVPDTWVDILSSLITSKLESVESSLICDNICNFSFNWDHLYFQIYQLCGADVTLHFSSIFNAHDGQLASLLYRVDGCGDDARCTIPNEATWKHSSRNSGSSLVWYWSYNIQGCLHLIVKRFNLSCKKDNISDAELAAGLAAEMAKIKTQSLQKEEAMKKSKELLFKEFCKYLDLETEEVKQRWIKMDDTEKLVWAKGFVSDWGESFHPLSSKSVKELVEEILVEENPNPIISSSSSGISAIDLNSLKKMIGF